MTVRNLSNIVFDELLECFLKAFENYYVEMPTDRKYYIQRWKAAKVDYRLSYGMFDNDKLIGFIIHAVDKRFGFQTAYNTGTGVISEYRGKRVIKSIYDYALNDLRKNGIEKSTLEVITENVKAVRAYESVGFKICKEYRCYGGELKPNIETSFELKKTPIKYYNWANLPNQESYSWDFQKETVSEGNYVLYEVMNKDIPESYFILSADNKTLAQLDLLISDKNGWSRLFGAIKQVANRVRIINVDTRLTDKLHNIQLAGLQNTVNQYEMELNLSDNPGC